jgi:hypothetical protein
MNIPKHKSFYGTNTTNNRNHFLQNNRNKKPAGNCLVQIKLAFYHKTGLPAELNNARKGKIFTF